MALLTLQYYSTFLCRPTRVQLLLPNDVQEMAVQDNENYNRPMKTLVLLHGYSGSCDDWLTGSRVQEISGMYNLAIAMPSGENSFYLDQKGTGRAYATFVGKELIAYLQKTFGIAMKAEDTFIGGLSMGGFGALHTGLLYPENYSKIAALSSALIVHEVMEMKEGIGNAVADYDYYKRSQCKTIVCDTSWKAIFAADEAAFDVLWDDMVSQLEGFGWNDLVAFDTEKYQPIIDARKSAQ